MLTKFQQSLGLALLTAIAPILLAVTPVAAAQPAVAQVPPTFSFATASGPVVGAVQLAAQGSHWFKFTYHYDNAKTATKNAAGNHNNVPTQALVML